MLALAVPDPLGTIQVAISLSLENTTALFLMSVSNTVSGGPILPSCLDCAGLISLRILLMVNFTSAKV